MLLTSKLFHLEGGKRGLRTAQKLHRITSDNRIEITQKNFNTAIPQIKIKISAKPLQNRAKPHHHKPLCPPPSGVQCNFFFFLMLVNIVFLDVYFLKKSFPYHKTLGRQELKKPWFLISWISYFKKKQLIKEDFVLLNSNCLFKLRKKQFSSYDLF